MTADRCSGCGHQGPPHANYCPRCGLPHAGVEVADSVDVANRVGRLQRGGRWVPLLCVFTMLAVGGLLGWRYVEPGSDATAPVGVEPDGPIGESSEPGSAAEPSLTMHATAAVPPPEEVELIELAVEDIPDQSELTALAGRYVVVSHVDGLLRLDTDTGQIERYDRAQIPGSLLGHYRDQLILVDRQRRVTAVSADDPAGDPIVLIDLDRSEWPWDIRAARMIDDHRLSLIVWSFADTRGRAFVRLLIDLDAGTVTGDTTDGWQTDDLAWVPGGGLFEFIDGSYRHLAAGALVAAGRRHVLIHECDGNRLCETRWIDRHTGQPVDRPLPSNDAWQLEFLDPDDRLLFVNGADGHRYFDAANGWFLPSNVIRGTAGGYLDHPAEAVVGGRLLLAPIVGGVVVYDLDSHAARVLDFGAEKVRGVTAIVAVPKPNPWVKAS